MAAIFMASCYQAEFSFAIEQTGIVRRIERVIFPQNQRQTGVCVLKKSWLGRGAKFEG